jgi:hypothetical protein
MSHPMPSPEPRRKNPQKITKVVVDRLQPGQKAWDIETTGFGVRCQRKYKVFILKYRFLGRPRWYTIGKHGSPWTVELARKEASVSWARSQPALTLPTPETKPRTI